jgi:hypothetical protein
MGNPDGIAQRCRLPNDEFSPAWTSIKLADGVHDRLLAQSLLSFIVRQKLPFEAAPLHGLILLKGPPGTGNNSGPWSRKSGGETASRDHMQILRGKDRCWEVSAQPAQAGSSAGYRSWLDSN